MTFNVNTFKVFATDDLASAFMDDYVFQIFGGAECLHCSLLRLISFFQNHNFKHHALKRVKCWKSGKGQAPEIDASYIVAKYSVSQKDKVWEYQYWSQPTNALAGPKLDFFL